MTADEMIRRIVAAAPPLTPKQQALITRLTRQAPEPTLAPLRRAA